MWFRGKNWKVFLIPLILPLFLLEPIVDLLRHINHTFWEVIRSTVRFMEINPLITIMAVVVVYLILTRRG